MDMGRHSISFFIRSQFGEAERWLPSRKGGSTGRPRRSPLFVQCEVRVTEE